MGRYSTATPPATKPLHPVLQSSLANLDLHLEAELSRYRRLRSIKGRDPSVGNRNHSKSLDLITVAATPVTEARPAPAPRQQTSDRPHPVVPPPPPPTNSAEPLVEPETHLAIATPQAASVADLVASQVTQPDDNELFTPAAGSADGLVETDEGIEDYLESSEELLRSLAEEEAKVQAERGFMQSLLTPLGLGSLLLLLLSSAMFGYIVMNPSSFSRWITTSRDRPNSASVPAAASSPGQAEALNPPQPNLAAREFKDLSLATLGTLKTSSATKLPKPTASPATAKTPASANSANSGGAGRLAPTVPPQMVVEAPAADPAEVAAPVPEPAPQPQAAYSEAPPPIEAPAEPVGDLPAPAVPEPQPAAEASEEPAPPAKPAAEAYPVRVVTPYTGDRSLDATQTVVPDAFVNGNGDVQAGAFQTPAEAEARAAELRKQGIPAEVQQR